MSKLILGLAEQVLGQPPEKMSTEAVAAALLLAHVAWNRAVDPLGGDQVGYYRKVLRALEAENPKCPRGLRSTDCEAMIQDLVKLKAMRYPTDDRIIRVCGIRRRIRCMWNGITGGLSGGTDAVRITLEEMMKRPTTKPEKAPAKPQATADGTLHIEWPWSMTWMEYVEEMLEFLKTRIGPGHPLHRKRLYVTAVNKDADAWYVEGEKEDLYAIVYFSQKKRYGGKFIPKYEILPDWDAVLQRYAADHKGAMSTVYPPVAALKCAFLQPRY